MNHSYTSRQLLSRFFYQARALKTDYYLISIIIVYWIIIMLLISNSINVRLTLISIQFTLSFLNFKIIKTIR